MSLNLILFIKGKRSKQFSLFKQAWRNILSNRFRSFLAILGVGIGTASIVALISIGLLTIQEAMRQFEHLGLDVHLMQLQYTQSNNPEQHARKMERLTPDIIFSWQRALPIEQLAVYADVFDGVYANGQRLDSRVIGVGGDFASLLRIHVAMGRFISSADRWRPFAVVGSDVAKQWQQKFAQPILGMLFRIGSISYQIIGVLEPWQGNPLVQVDLNTSVMIPVESALMIGKWIHPNYVLFRLREQANINSVQSQLRSAVEKAIADRSVAFKSPKEIIDSMAYQQSMLQLFLMVTGGTTLLLGAIGIMNAMLVSVVERKKEIGIRIAVGARPSDVLSLFLVESMVLSFSGGVAGVLCGILGTAVCAWLWQWHFSIFVSPCLLGAGASIATGLFAGVYPAWQAARVDPIDALRSL